MTQKRRPRTLPVPLVACLHEAVERNAAGGRRPPVQWTRLPVPYVVELRAAAAAEVTRHATPDAAAAHAARRERELLRARDAGAELLAYVEYPAPYGEAARRRVILHRRLDRRGGGVVWVDASETPEAVPTCALVYESCETPEAPPTCALVYAACDDGGIYNERPGDAGDAPEGS